MITTEKQIMNSVSHLVSNDIETQLIGPMGTVDTEGGTKGDIQQTTSTHPKNGTETFWGLTSSPVVIDKTETLQLLLRESEIIRLLKRPKRPENSTGKKRRGKKFSAEDVTPKTVITPKSSVLKSKRRRISVDSQVKSPLTGKKDQSNGGDQSACIIEIVTSMLSKENQAMILEFCEFFQVPLSNIFSQDTCSHLVISTTVNPTDNRMIAKRSFKYLQAKLSPNCKIVSIHWIETCLSHKLLLPETKFIIDYDEETINLLKSEKVRGRNSEGAPGSAGDRIFEGETFYFYGQYFSKPTLSELITLSTMGGAVIITELAEMRTGTIVLCDALESNFEKDAGIIERHKPILSTAWILDCISLGQVIKLVDPYIIM